MSWKAIVVGVDASPESAWAAAVGADMAKTAGTSCHLVHATRDASVALALAESPERAEEFNASLIAQARDRVQHGLWGVVPTAQVESVTIRAGRASVVLEEVAAELDAGLVMVGGKLHSIVGRWLAGSTGLDVARTTEVPLLVTGSARTPIHRVLAAVDLSGAAQPTIEAAERYAELFDAELRVLSVIEPLPAIPEAPNYDLTDYYASLEDQLKRRVWPLVRSPQVEKVIRYGMPVDTILGEAGGWPADLVVVGSHGKGWVDRVLIGSVTERLLNQLPMSLLVVPVHALAEVREPAPARAQQTEPRPAFA
jgi:nucleotide-binding universal stress UspA family protein